MKTPKTIQALQSFGKSVVKQGRGILKNNQPYSKTTSKNTLYKDFDYMVKSSKDKIELEWVFGGAEKYWEFVDEGVQGSGKPDKKTGYKVKGKMRGVGSPFRYTNKMPPRGAIDRWIVRKPLTSARDKQGRFIKRKTMAFFIQRSIFQRGLERTQFFTKPYNEQIKKNADKINQAFADDLLNNFKNL